MARRILHTLLTTLAALGTALAALAAALLLTPAGPRLAAVLLSRSVEESGLRLTVDSVGGSFARGVVFDGVTLSDGDGAPLLELSRLRARMGRVDVWSRSAAVRDVRMEDARVLIEVAEDGGLVGWSRLGAGPDSSRGTSARRGWELELDAAAAGSLEIVLPSMSRPLRGRFDAAAAFSKRTLELTALTLRSDAGDAAVRGRVSFAGGHGPTAELFADSTHELAGLASLLGLSEASGKLSLRSTLRGPLAGPRYDVRVNGTAVTWGGVEVERLAAVVAGEPGSLTVGSLRAEALGGALDADARVEFSGGDGAAVSVSGDVSFEGLDMRRVAGGAAWGAGMAGALSGSASGRWKAPGLTGLTADFALSARDLHAGGRALGGLDAAGRVDRGMLRMHGACCGTSFEALGSLSDDGFVEAVVTAEAADLAVPGGVFGAPELRGSGRARVELTRGGDGFAVEATAEFPELEYLGVQYAPVAVEAGGRGGRYDVLFTAFGSTVLGTATVRTDERSYRASVEARDLDMASVVPDSFRRSAGLSGRMSASASVRGRVGGSFVVSGEVAELFASARGESAEVVGPFGFTASRDSVRIEDASLTGTFGSATISGVYSRAGALDLAASFRGLDLSRVCRLLPRPPERAPSGTASGDVTLSGTRESPVFSANASLSGFEAAGVAVSTARLEVTGDSADVMFDLSAESVRSGELWAGGDVPVRPDPATLLAFDSTREFGVSMLASGFTLEGGEALLPGVRGEKRFVVDGSLVLTGTADSAASVNGSGLFSELSAEFDLARFSLADTVRFQVAGGRVFFDSLAVDVTRRRVLGSPEGGRLTFAGSVDPDGDIALTASARDLDVGHVARALGRRAGGKLGGRLSADAEFVGRTDDPMAMFTWTIESPELSGFRFARADGAGRLEAGVLAVDEARLTAGRSVVEASGELLMPGGRRSSGGGRGAAHGGDDGARSPGGSVSDPTPGAAQQRSEPTFDIRVKAERFRLKDLKSFPPAIEQLDGVLEADLRARGTRDSLDVAGTLTLTDGKFAAFDLEEPLRKIALELEGRGGTVALTRASADVGPGRMEATGLADLSGGLSGTTFYATLNLRSPEFAIRDLLKGRVTGSVDWGGTPAASSLRGRLAVERMKITRSFGLTDLIGRQSPVIVVRRRSDPRDRVRLDLDVEIEEGVKVESKLARFSLDGGATVGGTLAVPRVSGSVHADGGTFSYMGNDFRIETLNVGFIDPDRPDPYVALTGSADVESRAGETYRVTVALDGFASEAVPILTSVPPLSGPDIVSLLTFGNTFGAFVSGGGAAGSSGDRFSTLAGRAFLSSAFGIAESTLERLLHLDRVAIERSEAAGESADTDVTLGKEFGGRLRVNYSTSVGRFSNQKLEVSLELAGRLWLETRTDPEGNHAVGLKLLVPFK